MENVASVFVVDLDDAGARAHAHAGVHELGAEENARLEAFGSAGQRSRYIAAHLALRWLAGVNGGQQARFESSSAGAPRMRGGPKLSLSHCENVALIGRSDRTALGVDIERKREVFAPPDWARRQAGLARFADGLPFDAMRLQIAWTRAEAAAKCRQVPFHELIEAPSGHRLNLQTFLLDGAYIVSVDTASPCTIHFYSTAWHHDRGIEPKDRISPVRIE